MSLLLSLFEWRIQTIATWWWYGGCISSHAGAEQTRSLVIGRSLCNLFKWSCFWKTQERSRRRSKSSSVHFAKWSEHSLTVTSCCCSSFVFIWIMWPFITTREQPVAPRWRESWAVNKCRDEGHDHTLEVNKTMSGANSGEIKEHNSDRVSRGRQGCGFDPRCDGHSGELYVAGCW